MRGFYYLASPYSTHPRGIEIAAGAAGAAAGLCMKAGINVYSPIAHWHPIALAWGMPYHYDYWKELNKEMVRASNGVIVLQLDGWDDSIGVTAEIAFARGLGKPVLFMLANGPAPAINPLSGVATGC